MKYFELYLVLALMSIVFLSAGYTIFVVMFVTRWVDKYNGISTSISTFAANRYQTSLYLLAFFPPTYRYIRRTKLFRDKLRYYGAEPRDILFFKIYGYSIWIGGLAGLLAFCIAYRW